MIIIEFHFIIILFCLFYYHIILDLSKFRNPRVNISFYSFHIYFNCRVNL